MKKDNEIEAMADEKYPIKCIENKDCIHEWCTIKKIERKAFIQGFKQCQEMSDISSVPYQTCPLCNGTGKILSDGFTSGLYQTCKVCKGAFLIPQFSLPSPPQTK